MKVLEQIIEPIEKEFSEETVKEIFKYCLNYPKFRAIFVFSSYEEMNEYSFVLSDDYLKNVNKVSISKNAEIYFLFPNQSQIWFQLGKEYSCARRVNALLICKSVKPEIIKSIFNPMLIPYIEKG